MARKDWKAESRGTHIIVYKNKKNRNVLKIQRIEEKIDGKDKYYYEVSINDNVMVKWKLKNSAIITAKNYMANN